MTVIAPRLFIVCGAAGSGKTTLVNKVIDDKSNFTKARKYSTRPNRGPDDDVISITRDEMDSSNFDLAYDAAGNRYAVWFSEVEETLNSGVNVIIPLTDIVAARRLKDQFGDKAVAICVMSALNTEDFLRLHGRRYGYEPSAEMRRYLKTSFDRLYSAALLEQWQDVFDLTKDVSQRWEESIPNRKDFEIRVKRVQDFQAKYFENLSFFDFTILNYREGHIEDMLTQFEAISRSGSRQRLPRGQAPLFVISGSSGSGKGMLAETLRILARHEINIVSKEGKRGAKPNDKRDGMVAIGEQGVFSPENSFKFSSHKAGSFAGTDYAFSASAIADGLQKGIPQYLVANTLTNTELRQEMLREFEGRVVFLYLWRLQDEDQMVRYQVENCRTETEANARIEETRRIYEAYCAAPSEVDHVLLNTGYPEALSEQIFHLLHHYQG